MFELVYTMKFIWVYLVFHTCTIFTCINGIRLQGTIKSSEHFRFLSKFGFQRTDPNNRDSTEGFIYGNITSKNVVSSDMVLVVVDSEYFGEFFGNRSKSKSSCQNMMNKINRIAFDAFCFPGGKEDFLRRIPCPQGELCVDEDTPENVVDGYQFTYRVVDTQRPRYWFLSIAACHLEREGPDPPCSWRDTTHDNLTLEYDIWLVNGNPKLKHYNPFEHQFSFELHDVFEIHLLALVLNCIVLPLWLYPFLKQRHAITNIFTICIALEIGGIVLNFLYIVIIAATGTGYTYLAVIGNLFDSIAQCFLVLFLLFIAKGWGITSDVLRGRVVMYVLWGIFTVLNLILFVWNLIVLDPVINTNKWQTYPGYLTLAFRLIIVIWFLYELRKTSQQGYHNNRLQFLQHFGAFFLVWFVYLPVLVLISTQISDLWRYKTMLSISYAADILGYIVVIHLLWPSRSVLYLINGEIPLQTWDLEITGLLDDIQETSLIQDEDSGDEEEIYSAKKLGNGHVMNGHVKNTENGAAVLRETPY